VFFVALLEGRAVVLLVVVGLGSFAVCLGSVVSGFGSQGRQEEGGRGGERGESALPLKTPLPLRTIVLFFTFPQKKL
jgi:hypothetical protein